LKNYLGQDVVILINVKKKTNPDLSKFFELAGNVDFDDEAISRLNNNIINNLKN